MQLDDSERFAKGEAAVERLGWLVMALVLVAAVSGMFANGPLSHGSVEADNATVRYQRFGRNQGRTTVEVEATAAAAREGNVEVWVAQDFLDAYDIEDVSPEPESTSTEAGGVVYSFPVTGADTTLHATLTLRPGRTGRHRATVAVSDGRPARFTQFVYP